MVWSRRGAALAATFCIVVFFGMTTTVIAQEITAAQEDHAQVNMPAWQFMQDGIVFAEFNRQGGPRGGKEGYREIFQVGETLDGAPIVDRQHPPRVSRRSALWPSCIARRQPKTRSRRCLAMPDETNLRKSFPILHRCHKIRASSRGTATPACCGITRAV